MSIYTGLDNGTFTINPGGGSTGFTEVVLPNDACGGDFDLAVLWTLLTVRGSNRAIGRQPGRRAFRRIVDESTIDLPFTVVGDCDVDGAENTDRLIGLQTNLDFLAENIGLPPTGVTRDCVLVKPDGSEWGGEIQTLFQSGAHLDEITIPAVLTVTIVDGQLEETGS